MKTKFTKGEWNFDPEVEIYDRFAITSDEGDVICMPESDCHFDGDGYFNQITEEQEANAHLIAAAPEMYYMLEIIAKYYVDEINRPVMKSDIEQLLAKARGEQ